MFVIALSLAAVEAPPTPMSVEVVRDPITDQVRAYATARGEGGNRLVVSCDPAHYEGPRVSFHPRSRREWLARFRFS